MLSRSGQFAAVVNDHGRHGEVVDLRTGQVSMTLDNGGSHSDPVPFSLAVAYLRGQDLVIHRTAWNRLDVSDAATGRLLTSRGPASYRRGDTMPDHYLDYFHGALYVSPGGIRIYDDGWFWQPVGIPAAWDLATWESEDGGTKVEFGWLEYWDQAITWVGDHRIAIEDVGDEDTPPCTRIFDLTQTTARGPRLPSIAAEITTLRGPVGRFFSDGTVLFSASIDGLSIWDPATGYLTDKIPGFTPTHYHQGARELVELSSSALRRWRHT